MARMHMSGAATSASNDSKDVSREIAASIPESANAYHTPNSSPKVPPRISTSKSASAVEMEVMVNPSPSQEAFKGLTRASSFHGYPGGDTQPMESQVYRDFTESLVKSTTTTPKKAGQQTSPNGGNNTYDTLVTEKTPKTCVEGETGYVDLENALPSPGVQSVSSTMNEFLTSPGTQLQVEENVAEPVLPKTPAAAGHKRRRSGEILTSTTTARQQPSFSQLFGLGQNAPIYSTTQLFNQTQAPSSPVPDGPRSDPVITRPSPNLHNQFRTSSPAMAMSSPVATMRPSTAGGPRDKYTSMQESQERRAARLRVELGLERDLDDDILEEEEEEEDAERRRFENKRFHKTKSEQAVEEFAKFRAPSRPGSRVTSSPTHAATIDLTTPATTKKGDPFEFEVSDDGNDADDNDAMEVKQAGEPEQTDDEYDELGQTVLRSQGHGHGEDEDVPMIADEVQEEEKDEVSAEPENALDDDALQQEDYGYIADIEQAQQVTQHSAIADSQPMWLEQSHSPVPHQAHDPSSISSFVPGSQYVGRTSQDQAQLPKGSLNSAQLLFSSNHQARESMLSSPPLPVASSAVPVNSPERFTSRNDEDTDLAGPQSVPESDLPGLDAHQSDSSRPVTADDRAQGDSNTLTVFSTAATHLSGFEVSRKKSIVKASPRKILASQQSNVASQSPRTAAGVRPFADIAATQSLSRGESRETDVDVDAFMRDVITADDRQFIEAISTPPQNRPEKRRKLAHASSTGATSSPKKSGMSDLPQQHPLDAEEDGAAAGMTESSAHEEDANEGTKLQSTNALQESPSKANEMPSATQESVREREKAGAKAVSQLLSTRSLKPQRATSSRNNKAEGTSRAKTQGKGTGSKRQMTAQAKHKTNEVDQVQDALNDKHDADDDVGDINHTPADAMQTEEVETHAMVAPNRVFALFKGRFNKFYPATWLSSSTDGSTYLVKFDDTDPTSIETQHVRKLDLRVGDQVKVDIAGMTNKTWLVKSFGPVARSDKERAAATDIYGRANLQVQAKASRNSLPAGNNVVDGEGEVVAVAMSTLYLTHTLWPHFADRTFTPPAVSSSVVSRAMTPSSSAPTQESETSTSKSRRVVIPIAKVMNGRTSHLREESVSVTTPPTGVGLFSGMVFALSYGPNGGDKEEVARLMRRNGGVILENGFDELFDLPNLDDSTATSPSKKSPSEDGKPQGNDAGLQLKTDYHSVGFVALIADRHSRRAKYVQALALGLPTLSGRWITDSLDASKNETLSTVDATPLPWSKYLLPAGESTYLSGAVRSRTMQLYTAKDAKLSDTIDNRDLLLNGDGVLIVAPKKGKANWERSKTYAFLTLALGASRVKRVSDLPEAKTLTSEEPEIWKWIYVDGSVAEASAAMFGKAAGGGKKRKRGDDVLKTDVNKIPAGDAIVKIVNDEFVVQSLILGALVD